MKRSPLNNAAHGGQAYGARHMSYNWKLHENANNRGYQPMEGNSYQRFPVNNRPQSCDDSFIPLDFNTPVVPRHEKHNAANRYSHAGGRGNASPGNGWNNYRNNYHATPRSYCNKRYSAYKHSPKQFHGQKRKGYKGAHRQINVSDYVDMNSFLEDPWENLVKKLDDSKDANESKGPENGSLSNPKLTDSDTTEKSGSKLLKDANDSQYSQECQNEYSADTSFETESTDLSQMSKINSSIESTIGDICSSPDSLNESTCSVNDKTRGATQEEDNTHLNESMTDTDQKKYITIRTNCINLYDNALEKKMHYSMQKYTQLLYIKNLVLLYINIVYKYVASWN